MTTSKRAVERAQRGLPEPPKCTAHKKDGSPCGRWPVRGATVCPKHGGAAPQVRKKAQERLAAAADVLMAQLLKIATSAESEVVRLAATRDALDRAGFGAAQLHKLALAQPWDDLLQEIVMDDSVFEDVAAAPRGLPAGTTRRRVFHEDGPDYDYNAKAVQEDEADEAPGGSGLRTPQTVRGEVVREWPSPGQDGAAPTTPRATRRARAAFMESMGYGTEQRELERSEYGDERPGPSAADDPTMPPAYIREAEESEGRDWRPGQRSKVRWTV